MTVPGKQYMDQIRIVRPEALLNRDWNKEKIKKKDGFEKLHMFGILLADGRQNQPRGLWLLLWPLSRLGKYSSLGRKKLLLP